MIRDITKELNLVMTYVVDARNIKRVFTMNNKRVALYSYNTHKYYVIHGLTTNNFKVYINKRAYKKERYNNDRLQEITRRRKRA